MHAQRFAGWLVGFIMLPLLFSPAAAHAAGAGDATAAPGLQTQDLRCEYLVNPLGMDDSHPRLSWTLRSAQRDAAQSAYQLQVATSAASLAANSPDLWDTGKVLSTEQNQIAYAGKPLASRQRCVWRVRAWDAAGQVGPWSTPARWEVGLQHPQDWHAQWIAAAAPAAGREPLEVLSATYEAQDGSAHRDVTPRVRALIHDNRLTVTPDNTTMGGDPALNKTKQLRLRYRIGNGPPVELITAEHTAAAIPTRPLQYLRQTFHVDRPIVRARLYATALGLYAFEINNHRVGDAVLTPDWTDYRKRVRYQAYDVTALLHAGDNAIAGLLANGWYAGHIGNGAFQFWGTDPCLLAQLELTFEDGSTQCIATDTRWRSHASAILASDIMNGEDFDARAQLPASDPSLVEDDRWAPATLRTTGLPPQIDDQLDQPVRELMTLPAKTVKQPTHGHWVFDLGQNMVGVPRVRVAGPAGTKITIRFAEMLNPDGTLYTANYRGAKSTDTYICRGGGVESWQPRFTFHGFRYVELTGLPQAPQLDAVVGVVLGSDTPSVGAFACSDPQINQLWSNIRCGQRGNFLSIPTDCPQRDERLGWMGDAEIFVGTAVYNADVAAFFTKWVVDVDDEQLPDGQFTDTAPEADPNGHGAPAWADAGVIVPWTIYRTYGDRRELARNLPHMSRWVDWCAAHADGFIRDRDRGNDFGDWLSIDADTSKELIGTAFFAHSTDLVARSADALGDTAAASKYAALFDHIKAAFNAKYVHADGSILGDTQTAYALALDFNLLPEDRRDLAAQRLADNVRAHGNHLTTGFVGVSHLLPALANNGHADVAYDLLLQDTFPSWLFSVKHGATTIWERWDGWTPEHGFQDPSMNSFNHYSLGSCGQWLYQGVAGIAQAPRNTGFANLVIHPQLGGHFTHASAEYNSIRGPVRSAWTLAGSRLTLDVLIPPNVTAEVHLPTTQPDAVTESGAPARQSPGVAAVRAAQGQAILQVGSGSYRFECPVDPR